MKNTLTLNHEKRTIIMDRTFAKYAENTMSDEYAHLQRVRKDYPNYTVIQRQIKRNPNKKTYNGLTFAVMKAYIESQSNSEKQLKVFEAVKRIAEMKGSKYPLTKKWFLNTYPDFKENAVKENETNALVSDNEIEAQAIAELALVG